MECISNLHNVPVLVTGGCGFIGSHLVEQLVACGAQVTILDNCSTGTSKNIAHLQHKVRLLHASVYDFATCVEAVQGIKIVFHLAAFISVPLSLENPTLCHETNILGTLNLLEASRRAGVERFIFSSSSAVYGSQQGLCRETMPLAPASPYGYSKWIGELACQQYARCFGLNTICLRYFNVYGARQNPHAAYAAVVAKFKYQMSHNLPITIFGDGTQTRDFIPVEQVVRANLFFALAEPIVLNGAAYNIATGKSINLFELVDLLKKEFPDYNGPIVFEPARPGDVLHVSADCSAYQAITSDQHHHQVKAHHHTQVDCL